ncbi:Serine carboxypeptidase-like 44 [Platanthera guangdongensis]|uniref:Serine carboxypeptidase-like 44 n=1 Tax=Platanthera guangdongensis TaxID=2320717 RepID=A0ABR2MRX4_9ASPA
MGRWRIGIFMVLGALMAGERGIHGHSGEEDLVVGLPGQPEVDFRQFAGYVDVDEKTGKSLFYYFAEADEDPDKKPLTLWLNGGFQPTPSTAQHSSPVRRLHPISGRQSFLLLGNRSSDVPVAGKPRYTASTDLHQIRPLLAPI